MPHKRMLASTKHRGALRHKLTLENVEGKPQSMMDGAAEGKPQSIVDCAKGNA